MIIWGKVVGALVGLALYGPPGIILGLVFGQIFDNGMSNLLAVPKHAANVRLVFFKTVFQTMGYLAKADGIVSEREIQVARTIMLHDFKLDNRQMLMAIGFFNEGKSANFNLTVTLNKFKAVCGKYTDLRKYFLELLVKASVADKTLRSAQRGRLLYICSSLGIHTSELEYQLRVYGYSTATSSNYTNRGYTYTSSAGTSSTGQDTPRVDANLMAAYNLLGVKSADNIKTIKNAYRRLMSKYHPDKLIAKGLPPEMMELAKEKTQQISAAYELIMRGRR